jgi:hypothetical protein
MVVAPAITWLLVTTSPAGVMITPVPWSSWVPPALVPPKIDSDDGAGAVASMDTTAGSTLAMTDSMLAVPLRRAGPAEISFTSVVDPECPTAATRPPPTAAPITAATAATASHRHRPSRRGGPVGAGGVGSEPAAGSDGWMAGGQPGPAPGGGAETAAGGTGRHQAAREAGSTGGAGGEGAGSSAPVEGGDGTTAGAVGPDPSVDDPVPVVSSPVSGSPIAVSLPYACVRAASTGRRAGLIVGPAARGIRPSQRLLSPFLPVPGTVRARGGSGRQ